MTAHDGNDRLGSDRGQVLVERIVDGVIMNAFGECADDVEIGGSGLVRVVGHGIGRQVVAGVIAGHVAVVQLIGVVQRRPKAPKRQRLDCREHARTVVVEVFQRRGFELAP